VLTERRDPNHRPVSFSTTHGVFAHRVEGDEEGLRRNREKEELNRGQGGKKKIGRTVTQALLIETTHYGEGEERVMLGGGERGEKGDARGTVQGSGIDRRSPPSTLKRER